jgi:hypothetical protein
MASDETKKLRSIVEETDTNLTKKVEKERARLQESIRYLEKEMLDVVKQLQTTEAGLLEGPKVNLKMAQKIHMRLSKIFDETYGEATRETVGGFSEVSGWITKNYNDLGVAAKMTSVDKDVIDTLRGQSLDMFTQFGKQAQDRAAQAMYNAVAAGGKFSDLVATFSGILVGGKDARGASMAQYAELWANDSIMNFHNSLNLKKAEDAGIETYLYFGNLINTSRDFCIQRVGKVFTKKEIESWNDMKWSGKSGPPLVNRGGWNCRHHWQPVPAPLYSQVKEDPSAFKDLEKDREKAKDKKVQALSVTPAAAPAVDVAYKEALSKLESSRETVGNFFTSAREAIPELPSSWKSINDWNDHDARQAAFRVFRNSRPKATELYNEWLNKFRKIEREHSALLDDVLQSRKTWTAIERKAVKDLDQAAKMKQLAQKEYDDVLAMFKQDVRMVDNPSLQNLYDISRWTGLPAGETRLGSILLNLKENISFYKYNELHLLPESEYIAYRRNVAARIFKNKDVRKIQEAIDKFTIGTEWVPLDIMEEMADAGYTAELAKSVAGKENRANFRSALKRIKLYAGDEGIDIYAHEWAHAVDDFFANNKGTGFRWSNTKSMYRHYLTEAEAQTLAKNYHTHHSGRIGEYKNGDGNYHIGNWLDDYEGRIYKHGGVGNEWWTMNLQRFAISYARANSSRFAAGLNREWTLGNIISSVGRETSLQWSRVKEIYPELYDFINAKFGRKFAYYAF